MSVIERVQRSRRFRTADAYMVSRYNLIYIQETEQTFKGNRA